MKIYVLGMHYMPEPAAVFNTDMCEYFNHVGHDVTIFTGFPHYPQWKIYNDYKGKIFKNENLNGIKVNRSFVYVPNKVTPFNRVIYEASFIISSFFRLLFAKSPNLIIVISTPIGLGITASLLSMIKNIHFIFHIKDLQPDTSIDLQMINNKFLIKLLYLVEKVIYHKALLVSTISKGMVKKIVSKGINKNKVILFKDWVDINKYSPGDKINDFSLKNKLTDKFVVSYCGNFGIKQGLELVLQVAKDTSSFSDIVYLLVGDGVAKNKLLKMSKEFKLGNVMFFPPQSQGNHANVLSASDICLIIQKSIIKDILIPSKLLHITSCGRPIISTAVKGSEAYNLIKDANCGVNIEPENAVELKEMILKIKDDPLFRKELGKNGRVFAEKYLSKSIILNSFHEKLIQLSSS